MTRYIEAGRYARDAVACDLSAKDDGPLERERETP